MLLRVAQQLGESGFWILTALASGRRHGYAIVQDVEARSDGAVRLKATTLYTVLERLAHERLVEADGDEVVAGRTRRYFRLTEAGAARLQAESDLLEARLQAAREQLTRYRPAEGPA
jgi:PadR family transcriptional regulator, regulatory protein PadR